jgi:hypothetical protein
MQRSLIQIGLATLLVLATAVNVNSQRIISKDSFVYKNEYQFSSIAAYNNQLILPSEKCDSILFLDSTNGHYLRSTKLGCDDCEIEGIVVYKDYLFLLSETAKNQKVIFYDLKREKYIGEYKCSTDFSNIDDSKKYGLEGIAVNNDICYIMQEATPGSATVIKQYKIIEDKKKGLWLEHITNSKVVIKHPDFDLAKNNSWRCSDIFYNSVEKAMYILLINYHRDIDSSKYRYLLCRIDKNNFDKEGMFNTTTFFSQKIIYKNLKSLGVFPQGKDYNKNLEGLTFHNNNFYFVTDNGMSSNDDCNKKAKSQTLLFKLSKNLFQSNNP